MKHTVANLEKVLIDHSKKIDEYINSTSDNYDEILKCIDSIERKNACETEDEVEERRR